MLYLIARFVLRPMFLLLRPTITGRENVPATGAFIIASNHLSFIDSMAIPLMAPRRVGLPGQGRVLHRHGHLRAG